MLNSKENEHYYDTIKDKGKTNINKLRYEINKHNLEHFHIESKKELYSLPNISILKIAKYFDMNINDFEI